MKNKASYLLLALLAGAWMFAQAPLPSPIAGGGSGGGSGTVTSVTCGSGLTGGTITTTGTCVVDGTVVAKKYFGTTAPGSVSGNLPGDFFTDTTAHNQYVCNAPSGTAAPACTSVTAAGWLLLNAGGAISVPGSAVTDAQCWASSSTLGVCADIAISGTMTTGAGGSTAGALDMAAGTVASVPANSFGIGVGGTMTTSQRLESPNAVTSAHSLMVFPAPTSNKSVWAYKVVPDCTDTAGQHINFTQSTDVFSCGTSGGSSASINTTISQIFDEFLPNYTNFSGSAIGTYGQLGWTPFGASYSPGLNPQLSAGAHDNHTFTFPGWLNLTTGGSANNSAGIHLAGFNFGGPWVYDVSSTTNWEFRFNVVLYSYFNSQTILQLGLGDSTNQEPDNSVMIEFSTSAGCTANRSDTFWTYVTRTGAGSPTRTASAVTPTVDHQYGLRIRSTSAGTILFSVSDNGAAYSTEVAITTTLPTADLAPFMRVVSCDTNAHRLYVDRFDYLQTGLARN